MKKKITYEKLKEAFTDILDGNSAWYEIRANTGLPEKRCKEIEKIVNLLSEEYR